MTTPAPTTINLPVPAPIVGASTLKAGEIQLATGATGLFALLGILIATLQPNLSHVYDSVVPYAESIVVAGAAIAHSIRDNGVTRGLSAHHVAFTNAVVALSGVTAALNPAASAAINKRVDDLAAHVNGVTSVLNDIVTRQAPAPEAAPATP